MTLPISKCSGATQIVEPLEVAFEILENGKAIAALLDILCNFRIVLKHFFKKETLLYMNRFGIRFYLGLYYYQYIY